VHTQRQHQFVTRQSKSKQKKHRAHLDFYLDLQLSRRCHFAGAWTLCTRSDNTRQSESKQVSNKRSTTPTSTCNSVGALALPALELMCARSDNTSSLPGKARANKRSTAPTSTSTSTCNSAGAVTLLALGHCAHEATTPGKARANKRSSARPPRLATQPALSLCCRLDTVHTKQQHRAKRE
jgi:hypothetical protein